MRKPRKMTSAEKATMSDLIERMSTSMHKRFPQSEESVRPSQLQAQHQIEASVNGFDADNVVQLPKAFHQFFEVEKVG